MDRAYQPIMNELLDAVVTGAIRAGSWLPRVEDIAARHATSSGPVREAIRALAERGIVAVTAGRGHAVLDSDHWALLDRDVLEAALVRHRDPQLLREAIDALRMYEVQGALLSAPRIRRGDLDELGQILDQMRASRRGGNGAEDRAERFLDAERTFHHILIAGSGNRFLVSALRFLHPTVALVRLQRAADRDDAVIRLHEAMLAAFAARDPAAAAAAMESYGKHLASWLRV
jgi:GntR family transcriptional regulator, transcriptional repressor for pyruvate dehydrogenase complex